MIRAGRERIAELRDKAKDEWRGGLTRAFGGIGAGAAQLAGAFCRTPGTKPAAEATTTASRESATATAEAIAKGTDQTARHLDWQAALPAGGKCWESSMNLWGDYHDRQAGDHGAEAEEHQLAHDIAERHAHRSREAQADANDSIDRTVQLLGEMLAADNAAQNVAVVRG
jgi:hypothetical protein